MNFDDLIRAERDTDALRLMAREMYDKGRIGQTRMLLMIRVADKYDLAKTDLEIVHDAKPYAHKVQDFLINLAKNEIVQGKKYNVRVPIKDGGDNSYIGLCVDVEDFGRKKPITSELRIFRHSNSVSRLLNTMTDINTLLENHKLWLMTDSEKGERADLRYADLRNADLSSADLRYADLRNADLSNADLSNADLRYADLSNADLRYADLSNADLRNADLRNADLRNANLDFSSFPLWCGSLSAHFDDKQLVQIAYHLVKAGLQSKNATSETKEELAKLIDFANRFHRVDECGKIGVEVQL